MIRFLTLIILFIGVLFSCEESTLVDNTGVLTLEFNEALPNLPSGYTYEVWLKGENFETLAGSFSKLDTTNYSKQFTTIDKNDLNQAQAVFITVESTIGLPQSSDFILFYGRFNQDEVNLSFTNYPAIGSLPNGDEVSASFQVKTVNTNLSNSNYNGIWFFDESNEALLDLNFGEVGNDLRYTAWQKIITNSLDTTYLNLGSFKSPTLVDDADFYMQNAPIIPEFPGEDFLSNPNVENDSLIIFPLDVRDTKLIIEAKPKQYEDTTKPFGLSIFEYSIDENTNSDTTYSMNRIPVSSGIATRN